MNKRMFNENIQERELYNEVMGKYKVMTNKKLKTIIDILNHAEGLCMPEFLEFCEYLLQLDKGRKNGESKKFEGERKTITKSSTGYTEGDIS